MTATTFDARDLQEPGRRRDVTVVPCRRPANELIEQAHRLGMHLAQHHGNADDPAALYAETLGWGTHDWQQLATNAGTTAPTSAVQCLVLAKIRRAMEQDA